MDDILLIGGGGHCRSVIDVIEKENRFHVAGIIDDEEMLGQKVLGYEIIGCDDELPKLAEIARYALITVGQVKTAEVRKRLFYQAKEAGFIFPVVVSPRAYVSTYACIGEGTVVMHDVLVNSNAMIGKNSILNSKSLVEHDSVVGDHCHISTGAIVNGNVEVKDGVFIGSNATTNHGITIAERSFIKAGSVVK